MNATRTCGVSACAEPSRARGLCRKHYARWKRTGVTVILPRAAKPKVQCSVDDCQKVAMARGWCSAHYTRWYETGSVELGVRTGKRGPQKSLEERFWAKVNKHGGTPYMHDPLAHRASGECWLWGGGVTKLGYGSIWDLSERRGRMAHRVSMEISTGGPIDSALVIDHLCRIPSCVNPAHLELVTVAENTSRGLAPSAGAAFNKAKTHCPQGHEYSDENTYKYGSSRVCRTCAITRTRERRKRSESS